MSENLFENFNRGNEANYINNQAELIDPFITPYDRKIAMSVAAILDLNDDEFLNGLRESDLMAASLIEVIEIVKKALKVDIISKKARWLAELEKKIVRFSIYCANADTEMDLKSGRHRLSQLQEEQSRKSSSNSDSSEKNNN